MPAEDQAPPRVVDLVVVGSGAAAMAAAATAAVLGARVLVLEKTERIGGASALSGGEIWIPRSRQAGEAGVVDSIESVETYLKALLGDAFDAPRTRAFLQAAPRALAWLEQHTPLRYALMPLSADYHSDLSGASQGGRSLAVLPFDGKVLREDFARLRSPLASALIAGGVSVCTRLDLPRLLAAGRSPPAAWHAARLVALGWLDRLACHPRGTRLTNGNALVGRLLATLRERGAELQTRACVRALLVESGGVVGVEYERGGLLQRVRSLRGVVLATGGYSASEMQRRHHFAHVREGRVHQSLPPEGNDGDALALAEPLGVSPPSRPIRPAAWTPVSMVPDGRGGTTPFPHFSDKGRPGILAVGPDGERFVNESLSYHEFVTAMLARGFGHAWLLADHRALRRYGLGAVRPFPWPLGRHLRSGYLLRATDLGALEAALGCPGGSLRRSVSRFNEMALRGIDADHRRGQSVFERRYGDAANLPNPALGPLAMAPFYAIKVIPGDIGTFIGLPIDGAARVLDGRARAVPGLYAAGNAAQSLFGGHYPSAGITLGPALTFGWLAARHALGHSDADRSPPDPEGALRDANATHPIA
jgi:succinate dehydrogenase/fumarate reductase flavoprotein subunit